MSRRIAIAFVFAASLAGCTVAKVSGRGTAPLILNNPTQRVTLVESFDRQKMVMFDYTGAFDVSEVLGDMLRDKKADAVTNLVITIKSTVPSFAVNVVTLGFANAKVFQIKGDLVRLNGVASLPGDDATIIAHSPTLEGLRGNVADFDGEGPSATILFTGTEWQIVR